MSGSEKLANAGFEKKSDHRLLARAALKASPVFAAVHR
jgi:hypothetical protein